MTGEAEIRELRAPHGAPHKPSFEMPKDACDTHFHIYEPDIALKPDRRYTAVKAGLKNYRLMAGRLGLQRGVVVTGSSMTSNAPSLAAIAAMGGDFKGLALIQPDVTDDELERLAAGGMTGFRISTRSVGGIGPEHLGDLAKRVAGLGWHVEIHMRDLEEVVAVLPQLEKLTIPYSIDHIAYLGPDHGPESPEFSRVRDHLAGAENAYINIYSVYNLTKSGPPAYEDMVANVGALIEARPDRILWGSNWPHPTFDVPLPNEGDLLDFIGKTAPDPVHLRQIFVDNPARLYGWV